MRCISGYMYIHVGTVLHNAAQAVLIFLYVANVPGTFYKATHQVSSVPLLFNNS